MQREVEKIGERYVLLDSPQLMVSKELEDEVNTYFAKRSITDWTFTYAPNTLGWFLWSEVATPHEFPYLFESQVKRFEESFFWFGDILSYGISRNLFSEKLYLTKTNDIDIDLLEKGWKKCFGNEELVIFALAVKPKRLLNFLTSSLGKALAVRYLRNHWDGIVDDVEREKRKEPVIASC